MLAISSNIAISSTLASIAIIDIIAMIAMISIIAKIYANFESLQRRKEKRALTNLVS